MRLPPSARLKLDLMFEGVRFTEALGRATEHSFPNFSPYRFAPGEPDPTGTGKAAIPYMLVTADDTHARIKGCSSSAWSVSGSHETGYELCRDDTEPASSVRFEPARAWSQGRTQDDHPRALAGLSLHGDMLVVNVAPGCEYFLAPKQDGVSMRCTFCTYGAPDDRTLHLGQERGRTELPESTYARMQEVLADALQESSIRHIYLVGGSLTDPREEGVRFTELARRVQQVNRRRIPVTCGSGALPQESLKLLHEERLVDAVCFNLEIWSKPLFKAICPGKHRYVGYDRWIQSLETAVGMWGPGKVYSAMVAGVEFGAELELSFQEAFDTAMRGAEDLCGRGILPIYSLFWPPAGRDLPRDLSNLRTFFERLQIGYSEIRSRHGLSIWDGFMCHRCSYMQLECDIDRGAARDRASGAA